MKKTYHVAVCYGNGPETGQFFDFPLEFERVTISNYEEFRRKVEKTIYNGEDRRWVSLISFQELPEGE